MEEKKEYRVASWNASDDGYHISGYAVVFNSRTCLYRDEETGNDYNEMIMPGALDHTDMADVVLRIQHQGHPLARTRNKSLTLSVDSHGLKIDADLSGSAEGRNAYEEVKAGLYDRMSFCFVVAEGGEAWDAKTRTREVRNISRLYDVSIVDFPAYDETVVQARGAVVQYAEPDRAEYRAAKVLELVDGIDADRIIGSASLWDEREILKDDTGVRKLENEIAELRCSVLNKKSASDYDYVVNASNRLEAAKIELKEARERAKLMLEEEMKTAKTVAVWTPYESEFRKENTAMEETKNFYEEMAEKRAAAGTSGMSNIIPEEIIAAKYRKGKNGFMPYISETHIANGGSVKIPYVADSDVTVAAHTENASITPDNLVPSVVTITHGELQETLAYSYLGMAVAAAELKNIVENALLGAMELKLDAVALAAANGITWVKTAGATQNAVQWAASGVPTLGELITLMGLLKARYTQNAKFFMNQKTCLAIIKNATGTAYKASDDSAATNGMYNVSVVDGLTKLFGVDVVIDSNMADGDVLYGDANAIHMNYAAPVEVNDWRDRDSLTEKFQICTAAGAGVEPAAFVRGANSI